MYEIPADKNRNFKIDNFVVYSIYQISWEYNRNSSLTCWSPKFVRILLDVNPFFPCESISALRVAAWALAAFCTIWPFGFTALLIIDAFDEDAEWWFGLALASALASMVICDIHVKHRT